MANCAASRTDVQAVDLRTTDAGALFRFTDVYSRMSGGQMAIMMDAPSANNPVQQGTPERRATSPIHDEVRAAARRRVQRQPAAAQQ